MIARLLCATVAALVALVSATGCKVIEPYIPDIPDVPLPCDPPATNAPAPVTPSPATNTTQAEPSSPLASTPGYLPGALARYEVLYGRPCFVVTGLGLANETRADFRSPQNKTWASSINIKGERVEGSYSAESRSYVPTATTAAKAARPVYLVIVFDLGQPRDARGQLCFERADPLTAGEAARR